MALRRQISKGSRGRCPEADYLANIWGRKSTDELAKEAAHSGVHGESRPLKRTLSALNLVALGIGGIIGAGIFVLTGHAAAANAGPAVTLSFVFGAVACAFAGLCYAEMASTVPISGSAYTYAYATLGELIAWIIGWDLILEYRSPPLPSRSAGPATSSASPGISG
jgi:APA family basic amino acid/polyamine antiporter